MAERRGGAGRQASGIWHPGFGCCFDPGDKACIEKPYAKAVAKRRADDRELARRGRGESIGTELGSCTGCPADGRRIQDWKREDTALGLAERGPADAGRPR